MAASNERAQAGLAYFRARGYSDAGAAAIVGNGLQESGLNPEAIHDNGTGLGAFGWRDPSPGQGRKTALAQFAADRGKPATDFLTQLAFVDHELQTSEKAIGDQLRTATSLEDATDAMISFERPRGWTTENPRGGDGWQNRLNYARQVLGGEAPSLPGFPDMGGAVDPAPVSMLEKFQAAKAAEAEDSKAPGFFKLFTESWQHDTLGGLMFSADPEFAPDPDFRLTEKYLKDASEQYRLPPEYLQGLAAATSEDHAEYLLRKAREEADKDEMMAQAGLRGVGASLLAQILDPPSLAAAIVSGGIAGIAVKAASVGRVGAAALFGGVEAATAGGTQAIVEAQKANPDDMAPLYAAGAGLVLGAGFGALSRAPATVSETASLVRIGRSLMDTTGLVQPRQALQGTAPAAGDAASLGAMRASPREALRLDVGDMVRLTEEQAPRSGVNGAWRYDAVGQLKRSENPVARALGILGEDAVGNADKRIATVFGATEEQALIHHRMETQVARQVAPALNEWATARGLNWFQRQARAGEFGEDVARFIRSTDPTETFDPAVVKAGQAYRDAFEKYREMLANPGLRDGTVRRPVAGFEESVPNPSYLPRVFNYANINAALERYGNAQLSRLVAQAVKEAQPDIAAEIADKLGKGYVRVIQGNRAGLSQSLQRAFSGDDMDLLRETLLRADGVDMQPEEVDSLIGFLTKKGDGAPRRGKERVLLNEHAAITAENRLTGSMDTLRFTDLLVNDPHQLFTAYSREMSGRLALARLQITDPETGGAILNGIVKDAEFETWIERLKATGEFVGQKLDDMNRDEANLRYLYRAIVGAPDPSDMGPWSRHLRRLQDFNFTRLMGQVGFAQVAEVGNIIGQLGWKASISGMGTLRTFVRDARTGKLEDSLAEEMEAVLGIGSDNLRGAYASRWDDLGEAAWGRVEMDGGSRAGLMVDNALQYGKRVTSHISGMAAINTALHRWTVRGIAHKFARLAQEPTEANLARLRTLGMGEEMLSRVLAEIRANATKATGELATITRLNLDKWTDVEARAAFENTAFRWARRIIQENDPGAMHRWSSNRLWKVLFQFRTFMLGAWTKQTLASVHLRDREAVSAFLLTNFLAGLVYVTKTNLQAAGRGDREEFLERRLTPENVALAAFQNGGASSIIPMLMDSALTLGGQAPVFDFRNTGLPSNFLFGNPTMSLLDDASKAGGGWINPILHGRQMSQQEARNLARMVPFSTAMPMVWALNGMTRDLPEFAPRNEGR
ncbi:hypothetical protein QFZ27_000170 [Inquilinus ginsengisoli]|uniref:phage tail tip lysozyme n=1 Tax=Inquilinus ginsengisoli TaxID=363840 RepID=UPI003D24096E